MGDNMFEMGEGMWDGLQAWRGDSWQNYITGYGTSRDKTMYGRYARIGPLPDQELSALYHENDICQRVVGLKPREMLRRGYRVTVQDDPDGAEAIAKAVRKLGVNRTLVAGMTWARLFGGGVILIGADDGGRADQPLNEERIRSLRFLEVIDRRYIQPVDAYAAREVEFFDVYPRRGSVFRIHASRLIVFGGALTTEDERDCMGGWDHSVLHAPFEVVRAHDAAWKAGEHLLADASQAVFAIKGLLAAIASGKKEFIQLRAETADMGRSTMRATLIDKEGEDFRREPSSFTDAAKMVELFMLRLCAAAEMPATKLFGRAPQGMDATGESDTDNWYDNIESAQENDLRPELERLLELMMRAQDGPTGGKVPDSWAVVFKPLRTMSPKEQAEVEKLTAEKDHIYVVDQVVLPEEIAVSRFTAEGWSGETQIDRDLRTRMLESEKTMLEQGGRPADDETKDAPAGDQPPPSPEDGKQEPPADEEPKP